MPHPAVVRGDVKPKTARTVAYMAQTLLQSIHISQHEYINTFGTDGWRKSIRNSVNDNHNYRFPPVPEPEQSASPQPQPAQPQTQPHQPAPASQPAPPPHTSLPPTSAEFVQRVVAGLQTGGGQAPQPAPATQPTPAPAPSPTSARAPQTPAAHTAPSHPACHPERSEGSRVHPASTTDKTHPIPPTQFARPVVPAAQPDNPPRTGPPTPQSAPNRDARALHFDHSCRLFIDGKPF